MLIVTPVDYSMFAFVKLMAINRKPSPISLRGIAVGLNQAETGYLPPGNMLNLLATKSGPHNFLQSFPGSKNIFSTITHQPQFFLLLAQR